MAIARLGGWERIPSRRAGSRGRVWSGTGKGRSLPDAETVLAFGHSMKAAKMSIFF